MSLKELTGQAHSVHLGDHGWVMMLFWLSSQSHSPGLSIDLHVPCKSPQKTFCLNHRFHLPNLIHHLTFISSQLSWVLSYDPLLHPSLPHHNLARVVMKLCFGCGLTELMFPYFPPQPTSHSPFCIDKLITNNHPPNHHLFLLPSVSRPSVLSSDLFDLPTLSSPTCCLPESNPPIDSQTYPTP